MLNNYENYRKNNKHKWWIYPQNLNPDYVRWYTILRRGIFIPFIYLGLVFTGIFLGFAYGNDKANEFWKQST